MVCTSILQQRHPVLFDQILSEILYTEPEKEIATELIVKLEDLDESNEHKWMFYVVRLLSIKTHEIRIRIALAIRAIVEQLAITIDVRHMREFVQKYI